MPKNPSTFDFPLFDEQPRSPLRQWLYERLRGAILDGRLKPGMRLPSSRTLAAQHAVARGTVVQAFEQLAAEGFIRSGVGSGTFVCDILPDALLQAAPAARRRDVAARQPKPPQSRARAPQTADATFPEPDPRTQPLFNPYLPALDEFPLAIWSRLVGQRVRALDATMLGDGDPRGYLRLRRSIAHTLAATRGINAEPEQILVVASMQQALDLATRLLLTGGDAAWIEDPGYPGARAILQRGGARLIPVPVDAQGMQVGRGRRLCESARMAYVTPGRQAPLGVCMSLSRRMALLEWASQTGAWIFEDDYDGEFRYRGRPLAALQSIDREGCVLYAGSFSKTLFPALRISYLVLPRTLVDVFVGARALTSRYAPLLEQAVLADFIERGHYARHLRRMNTLYAARRAALVAAVTAAPQVFDGVSGDEAGLGLVAWLRQGLTERDVVHAARGLRLIVQPLGPYVLRKRRPPGLILGFAAATPAQIGHAMRSLVGAMP